MSYRVAFFLLAVVFAMVFAAVLFRGEVIFPHGNGLEAGSLEGDPPALPSNRKFSDESSVFIPELANNLDTNRRGWLATWNPHVELGRPASQLSGLNRSYPLTNLLACLTKNPFVLYTVLVLVTIAGTGVFFLLFLRALGLHAAAALVAVVGLVFTTMMSYWLTFIMFLSPICWTVCLLWLITQFTRRPSWFAALGMAFATYSLLLTAYPQIIVLDGYLFAGFGMIRLRQVAGGFPARLRVGLALFGCASVGALAALPVYLDLWTLAQDSVRMSGPGDGFFLGVMPAVGNLGAMASSLATIIDWSWLGNGIDPAYPIKFNGLSFTPVFAGLICLSFLLRPRVETVYWQVFLVASLLGTIIPALYLFAVHHLGFGLSRIQLLAGGIVPGFILCGYSFDRILKKELSLTFAGVGWALLPFVELGAVAIFVWPSEQLHVAAVIVSLGLLAGLLCSLYFRSIALMVGLAIISALLYGRPLILSRPLHSIHLSSKLVEAVKILTPGGSRFAVADRSLAWQLPPNQEGLLGLASVNSYNSLLSRRYARQVRKWSLTGPDGPARQFRFLDINLALADEMFSLSDVRVILSARPLHSDRLTKFGDINGIKLYQPTAPPISLLQTPRFQAGRGIGATIDRLSVVTRKPTSPAEQKSDFQEIQVTASPEETLLFLSQQFHPDWKAVSKKMPLRTVLVNGFYQGVIIPPRTTEVNLSFRPLVLWSWVPQVSFALAGTLLILRASVAHLKA